MMNVVVIGGVAAGMSAASKLKRNLRDDVDIVVYEKGTEVSYGACGIPFYVSGHIKEARELIARTPEQFRESGIDVQEQHEVLSVDTAAKTVQVKNHKTGEEFTRAYDKLIVGSGAAPAVFPPFDVPKQNLASVRNVEDGVKLRGALEDAAVQNVVVVGGGFIGLEIAEACKRHGKAVTLVELADRVLTSMDEEITARLEEELAANGVVLKSTCCVSALECDGESVTGVVVDGGETIPADLVVNCAGIKPATGFIDGVDKLASGAIKVDKNMQTSLPDIYAAGDCSVMQSHVSGQWQYMPMGTNANKQGRIIADVIAGKPAPEFKLIGSAAIRLFGLDAAKVGLSENDAKALGVEYKTTTITGNSFASYYGTEKVTIKLVYAPADKKILGAQLVGQGTVVPRANYYAIAIANGMPADDYGFMDLCYSPPFSGVWDVSLIAANTCK